MGRSPVRHGSDAGEELVLTLVREQAGELLRFARRLSICVEDAQDAYQRTLEKLVRRVRTEPPEHAGKWVRTVLRNEALAIRAEREQLMGRTTLEDERHRDAAALDPAERVERFERLAHTAEALSGLKPQEVTALALRAEGLSYKEICARTGWTYTRCNRAVSEGRRALLERLRAIESGAECERWLPLLSALADGEANARELAQLRPHLRACPGCRATLRRFHAAPRQVAALLPAAALPAVAGVATVAVATTPPEAVAGAVVGAAEEAGAGGLGIGRHLEAALHGLAERANTTVLRFHSAIDALPSAKLAAVAASTVAVAGGGAAIEHAATAGAGRAAAADAAPLVASAPAGARVTPISTGSSAPPASASTPAAAVAPSAAGSGSAASGAGASADEPAGPFAEFALEPLADASAGGGAGSGAPVFGASRSASAAASSSSLALALAASAPADGGAAVGPSGDPAGGDRSQAQHDGGNPDPTAGRGAADPTADRDPVDSTARRDRSSARARPRPPATKPPASSPPAEFPATSPPPSTHAAPPQTHADSPPPAPSGAEFAGP